MERVCQIAAKQTGISRTLPPGPPWLRNPRGAAAPIAPIENFCFLRSCESPIRPPISETAWFHAKYRCVSSWNLEFFHGYVPEIVSRIFHPPGKIYRTNSQPPSPRLASSIGCIDFQILPILRNRNFPVTVSVIRSLSKRPHCGERGESLSFDRFDEFPLPLIGNRA